MVLTGKVLQKYFKHFVLVLPLNIVSQLANFTLQNKIIYLLILMYSSEY